jgi:sugar/nucleoside kinase (ribokinase family)
MTSSTVSIDNPTAAAATTTTDSDDHPISADVSFHIVGDAYVDFFCFLDGDFPESGGDSRLDQPVRNYAGGSSTNTATHLKALIKNFTSNPKPPVTLHTVLNPDDHYGRVLLEHAEYHDLPIRNCRKEGDNTTTGHCIAIVSGGERSFMTHQGMVGNFVADDVDVDSIINTPTNLHLHVAGFYNIPGFWNGQLKRRLETIREHRQQRFPHKYTTISLVTQHDATKVWDGGLDELIPLLDFVLMNDLEARSIVKRGGHVASDWEHEHLCWADYFGRFSPTSNVIVTRGEKGAVALRGGEILGKQKPIVVTAIDPTGAGDSFTAGFIHGLWLWKLAKQQQQQQTGDDDDKDPHRDPENDKEKWPIEAIEEGMRWGVSVGSAAILIRGASIPPEGKDIQNFLEQAKEPEHPVFHRTTSKEKQ